MDHSQLLYLGQAFFMSHLSKDENQMWPTVLAAYQTPHAVQLLSYKAAVLFAVLNPGETIQVIGMGAPVVMSDLWETVQHMSNSPFGETFRLYNGRLLTDAIVTGANNTLFCQQKEE